MIQVLEVCSEIRKMKRVQNILKKHGPRSKLYLYAFPMNQILIENISSKKINSIKGYLFSTDSNMLEILRKFQNPINSLTFSLETIIQPMAMDAFDDCDKLILSSIVNDRCSVAISTDIKVQLIDIQERNRKKLAKLEENLNYITTKMSSEKYKKKAKSYHKAKDLKQVS